MNQDLSYAQRRAISYPVGARVTLKNGHPDAGRSGEYIGTKPLFADRLPIPVVMLDKLPGKKAREVFVLRGDYWGYE